MKKTIDEHIVSYLIEKPTEWRFGGVIDDHVRGIAGAKASNVGRRCRELFAAGVVDRQLVQIDGKGPWCVMYRIKADENRLDEFEIKQ
jgi:DNA-binding Lrp family transcriptional regulator